MFKHGTIYIISVELSNGRVVTESAAMSLRKAAEFAAHDIAYNIIGEDISVSPNYVDWYRVQVMYQGRAATLQAEQHELADLLERGAVVAYWNAADEIERIWINELKLID